MADVLRLGDDDPVEIAERATAALRRGQIVVLPTDTVYGLAADAFHRPGVERVFAAKQRDHSLPLPVMIRAPRQLEGLVTAVSDAAHRLMAAYWPGPLTIVVRHDPNLQWFLGDNRGTVGVRMPAEDVVLDVIRAVGPLAVTSANRSGQPAATTVDEAMEQLGDDVGLWIDGGPRTDTSPSTIVDLTGDAPAILRAGPLDGDTVLGVATGEIDPLGAS
ncbi:MAG: L-threonylcarbamoyladenylate synthase [Nitriliruptorales bacterium]|nr:L-threonylcarbamoyladenylate synthase [Nitriliruptorales bacterium]